MTLQEFLTLILPSEGVKCWVAIKDKVVKQGFTNSISELALLLGGIDSKQWDAYFACSSFKTNENRKVENVLGAKAFWLDIDAGEGKPYKDADGAIEGLEKFTGQLGAPSPIVIRSGNGIHAYWPLDRALPVNEWLGIAKSLKALCEIHGLRADPSRTADLSSILRPPFTYNWKNPKEPKAVKIEYEDYEIASTDNFSKLILAAASQSTKFSPDTNSSIIGITKADKPSMTQGYPDGQRTHEMMRRIGWCAGPMAMTEEQTLEAILTWNQYNHPPKNEEEIKKAVAGICKKEKVQLPINEVVEFSLPYLPEPFSWDIYGRMRILLDSEDGAIKYETIAEHPVYLDKVCKRESDGINSYLFKRYHPKEGWKDFSLPTSEVFGSNWIAELAENGAIVNAKYYRMYIKKAVEYLMKQKSDSLQYEKFGWKEDNSAFLVGNTIFYTNGTTEETYTSDSIASRAKAMRPPINSTLKDWTYAADKMFSPGMEAYGFSLLAGFASVMMKFCIGESEGGAVLSLYSPESGRGKTRALEAIASIWGNIDAVMTVGKDTTNSRFVAISQLCNLPVLEEELTEMDPKIIRDFIKAFTTGRDKTRAKRDGSVILKDSRYQTILISTSNSSVFDLVQASNDEGAIARVFELTIDLPNSQEFTKFKTTVNMMLANRGHAGRAFVSGLTQPGTLEWITKNITHIADGYFKKLNAHSEHRYIVWLLTACAFSGILLNRFGILHFDVDRIMAWGLTQANSRVKEIHPLSNTDFINMFINEHSLNCLIVDDSKNTGFSVIVKENVRELIMRYEIRAKKLYISRNHFNNWCRKQNKSAKSIWNQLYTKQIVSPNDKYRNLAMGTGAVGGRVWCIEVDMSHPEVSGELKEVIISNTSAENKAEKK